MNLAVLQPSRRVLENGDIFAMQLHDRLYLHGRVVDTEALAESGMSSCVLVYIYSNRSQLKRNIPRPSPKKLLLPPLITNRLPWTRGYFEFLENRKLTPGDVLPQHCFATSDDEYFDEKNRRLPEPVEPVGQAGLHSLKSIDDAVSQALGIPLAPE